jgi:hypothetical protein
MRLPRQNPRRPFFPVQLTFAAALLLALLPASGVWSVAQVTSNLSQLHFGTIVIGQSESLPITLTNAQSTSVTISAVSSTSGEFSVPGLKLPLVLGAGQSAALNVTFAPTIGGWQGGQLAFTSNASNKKFALLIGGTGVASEVVKSSASSLGFGSVAVGSTATLPVALTNAGTTAVVIAQAQLSGTGFSIGGPTLPLILLPNQSATFNVAFSPQSATSFTGSLIVPNGSVTIPISGTGTTASQLVLSPAAMNFGNVNVGSTSTLPVTLTANGGAVTISSSASSSSQFSLQGASFPLTIASGKSASFSVAFTPNNSGSTSGTLSLSSNASDSNAQEGLSGIGVAVTHNVSISWQPSVSQVTGYNVYRGASPMGTYSKVNSSLNPGTSFTDSNVTSGQTYYYAATSVNSAGEESTYSTPVQVVIP